MEPTVKWAYGRRDNHAVYIVGVTPYIPGADGAVVTLAKGTAVTSLYSHIAHSNDKDKAEIPQPFKGAHPKQPKPRGGGKGKQPQQKPKNPPPQTQDDQYNYEDTNNYYHNENYRGQSRCTIPVPVIVSYLYCTLYQ